MNANGYDIVALVVIVAYGIAYFLLMRHERKQLDIAKRLDARRCLARQGATDEA